MKHQFHHRHKNKSITKSIRKTKKLSKKIGVRTYITTCIRTTSLCYHVEIGEANAAIAAFAATLAGFAASSTVPEWGGSPELMVSDETVVHHWGDTYAPQGYVVTYSDVQTPMLSVPNTVIGQPDYIVYDVEGQATFRIVRTTYHGV
jgi:hypothetical protein